METTEFEDTAAAITDRIRPQLERAKSQLGSFGTRVTGFIKEHPGACLFGALAAGYLVARIARRR